jgi:hypothetical protein
VDPYGWAVLTAALDVTRLGGRAPLPVDLLRVAAPGYCTSAQQAQAPPDWFERALAYATGKLHGAAAALSPAGAGVMGQVAGYTVADYLLQHASRERRPARMPASTWDALLSHIRDPADAAWLALSAERRLLYCYAIPLYRHAADAGVRAAALQLARLLAGRGDLDEAEQILPDRADSGPGKIHAALGACDDLGRATGHPGAAETTVITPLTTDSRPPGAGAGSEQWLAAGGGAARASVWWPGGRGGLERGLDGVGDKLRGLGLDGDVAAEQHAVDDLPGVPGRILRADGHCQASFLR